MELELLKENWSNLETRIKASAAISEKLVDAIIRSRVMTTVDRIRRQYAGFYVVLIAELVFLTALFLGNPFDFRYTLQYIPYVLITIGVLIAFVNLLSIHKSINKISPVISIGDYVKGIVSIYDRNRKFEKWFGTSLFAAALLVPFSFLPQKLDRMSAGHALLDTLIMISVSVVLFFVAVRLGAFRNRNKEKLERDLSEWQELKNLASGIESIS
jgi:hypothetical protein